MIWMLKFLQMVKNASWTFEEYERHKRKMKYSSDLDYILKEHVKILVDWINNERGPFSEAYVNIWYKRYVELKNR